MLAGFEKRLKVIMHDVFAECLQLGLMSTL
jgi:hypothetical protein